MKHLATWLLLALASPVMAGSSSLTNSSPRQERPLVLASRQVIGPNRLPVGFAYRETSKDSFDSGWVFLSGKESQEFLDDSANSVLSPLDLFIEMDPSLSEIVDKPVGTYWQRVGLDSPWQQIADYPGGP